MPRNMTYRAVSPEKTVLPRRSCLFLDLERRAYPLFDPNERRQDRIWLLDYFYDPGLRFRLGTESAPWTVRPAHVARLYSPGVVYWQDSTHCQKPLMGAWLTFCAIDEKALLQLTGREGLAEFDDPEGVLGQLLAAMAESIKRSPGGPTAWRDLSQMDPVLDLLRGAIRVGEGKYRLLGATQATSSNDLVARANAYMREHFHQNTSRLDVARALGVSVSQLSHVYVASAGRTPMAYLHDLRVQAASHLIEQGTELKDVAASTGFCDAAHLSRVFKAVLGISPKQFRDLRKERDKIQSNRPSLNHVVSTLFGAVRLERDGFDYVGPEICSNWTLDAFLTPGVKHRIGSISSPWVMGEANELWLYSSGCPYWENADEAQRPIISFSARFQVLPGSPLLRKTGWPSGLRFRDPKKLVIQLLEKLVTLAGERSFEDIRQSDEILQRIIFLLCRAAPTGPGVFSVGSEFSDPAVTRAMHYLENHFPEALTRKQVARAAGVSLSKLDRSCVLATGEHPMQLLRRIRIDKAKSLLLEGQRVLTVAEATGFSDPQAFSHTFRRVEGISPRDYVALRSR